VVPALYVMVQRAAQRLGIHRLAESGEEAIAGAAAERA